MALLSAGRRVTLLHHPGGDLGARAEPELGQDVLDVRVCRPLGDEQFLGDLAIGQAARNQRGHLALTPGERTGERAAGWTLGSRGFRWRERVGDDLVKR